MESKSPRKGEVTDVRWGGDGDVFRIRSGGAPEEPVSIELFDAVSRTWGPVPEAADPPWRVLLMPSASDALLGKVGLSLAEAMIP